MIIAAFLIAGLAGLTVVALGYRLIPAHSVPVDGYLRSRGLDGPVVTLPWYRGLLAPFEWLVKYLPQNMVKSTEYTLYWAHQAGTYRTWNAQAFLALRLAGGVGGFLVGWSAGLEWHMVALAAGLGFYLPGLLVSGKARRYRDGVRAELPDAVNLLAMLMQSGKGPTESLRVVAQMGTPLGVWLTPALAHRGQELANLSQRAKESGLRDLITFSIQLQNMSAKGRGMAQMLSELGRDMSQAYQAEREAKAAQIGGAIFFPVLLFYFVPYLLVILAPMAMGAFGLFG
ncbi:MAG: type II secretion system F family protein [Chloroflexi bacterium]|nr:type II secretion system F family protein [Chloroflexota bacterium]MBU1752179.1 type II secretion system F family protein [Chloroflexota bacterium]